MRGKRAKQYRKLMHQYELTFAFRAPYQVLLDAAIIKDAANFKMRLGAMLASTLHGEIKPMITQCCIRHLYDDPAPDHTKQPWIDVAKLAERRRCGHHELPTPLSPLECLASVVDPKGTGANKHRYVVASQDVEVRRRMRQVAGVPLVYIARSVMILEPMAGRTEEVKEREERGKIRAGLISARGAAGEKRKREEDATEGGEGNDGGKGGGEEGVRKKRKVRGPKEPNPLSAKRSKKTKAEGERSVAKKVVGQGGGGEKRESRVEGEEGVGGVEGQRKRKRKRQPKDTADGSAEALLSDDHGDA